MEGKDRGRGGTAGHVEGAPELEEEDVVELFEEDENAIRGVTTTLREQVEHWEKTGASDFSLSVIKEDYKLQLENCPEDVKYEEKNNKSYWDHREFADKAGDKLVAIGVVKRVRKSNFNLRSFHHQVPI